MVITLSAALIRCLVNFVRNVFDRMWRSLINTSVLCMISKHFKTQNWPLTTAKPHPPYKSPSQLESDRYKLHWLRIGASFSNYSHVKQSGCNCASIHLLWLWCCKVVVEILHGRIITPYRSNGCDCLCIPWSQLINASKMTSSRFCDLTDIHNRVSLARAY